MKRFFDIIMVVMVGVYLSGCTPTIPPSASSTVTVVSSPLERKKWLASLHDWEATGRFAVKQQHEGWSGSFAWEQYSKNHYQIHFYGPFGTGNTYLLGTPKQIVWKDNEGETKAATPDELVWMKTGFIFPVSYLYDWIVGRPAPGFIFHSQHDKQGRLTSFTQEGWEVQYLDYQSVAQGELPRVIRLIHDDIQLKLVIQQWKIQ